MGKVGICPGPCAFWHPGLFLALVLVDCITNGFVNKTNSIFIIKVELKIFFKSFLMTKIHGSINLQIAQPCILWQEILKRFRASSKSRQHIHIS